MKVKKCSTDTEDESLWEDKCYIWGQFFLDNGWQGKCEESLMGGKRPIQIIQTLGIDL